MFKFLKNMCSACGCGPSSQKEKEQKEQYKCRSCGKTSDKAEKCCGALTDKKCDCGSGKYAKDCCEA